MGGYSPDGGVSDYLPEDYQAQADNPAAPGGLQQVAQQNADSYGQAVKQNQPFAPAGYDEQAQKWFTGANSATTGNGLDTAFQEKFQSGWDTALQEGNARNYFDHGTGVVTWDHVTDTGRTFHFGDVVEDGKIQSNLYDQFDQPTADLMVAPYLLDARTQAEIFNSPDDQADKLARLHDEIMGAKDTRNQTLQDFDTAQRFNSDVKDTAQQIHDNAGLQTAEVLGGGAGGAAIGFGVAGPVGAAVGFGLGAAGAWLNRDAIDEQAARAWEVTQLSFDTNNPFAATGTAVSQFSQVFGKNITPLQNLTQGIYDATAGKGGDGVSEFYRTDEQGKNAAPGWVRALDLGSALGDSLLQFASPLGAGLYTAQMAGTVTGEVAELGFSGGQQFDYGSGKYVNIFRDRDGNLDLASGSAGIMNIGIDAVQLGFARGLLHSANAANIRAAGIEGAEGARAAGDALYGTVASKGIASKLPLGLGGTRGLADDEERVLEAGWSMTRNKTTGELVAGSARPTLALIAPSEHLRAMTSWMKARRVAAAEGGAVKLDDFYRFASSQAIGENRLQSILINGFGEAYEEAAQALLEPVEFHRNVDWQQLAQNAAYGFASGAGMTAGTKLNTASSDRQMFGLASYGFYFSHDGARLTRDQWNEMNEIDKRKYAAMGPAAREVAKGAYAALHNDIGRRLMAGPAAVHKYLDAYEDAKAAALSKANGAASQTVVITQHEAAGKVDDAGHLLPGYVPNNSVTTSLNQLGKNLAMHGKGLADQLVSLKQDFDRLVPDPAQLSTLDQDTQDQAAAIQAQRDVTELTLQQLARVNQVVAMYMGQIYGDPANGVPAADEVAGAAYIDQLNDFLRRAFNMELDAYQGQALAPAERRALARATTIVAGRHPNDQRGSFQALVPQASLKLTLSNSDNVFQVDHAILTAIGGDYDGDKIQQLAHLIVDDLTFTNMRSGSFFLGAGSSVNVKAPKYEKYLVEAIRDDVVYNEMNGFGEFTLQRIASTIRRHYSGVIETRILDSVLNRFFDSMRAGDPNSRKVLQDALAEDAGAQITAFSREHLSNEWLWLDQVIVSNLQMFSEARQRVLANRKRREGQGPSTDMLPPEERETAVRERRVLEAVAMGDTMSMNLPGNSLFRAFQDLHYDVINAAVSDARNAERGDPVSELVAFYRMLSQETTLTELDRVQGRGDITVRVRAMIDALVDDLMQHQKSLPKNRQLEPHTAKVMVANMAVEEFFPDVDGGGRRTGHRVTLAQQLLRMELDREKADLASVFDSSPELQARDTRLRAYTFPNSSADSRNAQQAFVEVYGPVQLWEILGEDALPFGAHMTVEQYVRHFMNQGSLERSQELHERLQGDPSYIGKKRSKRFPYSIEDVRAGKVNAYKSVVDSITATAAGRISRDADGTLHGEIPEQSKRVSATIQSLYGSVRAALRDFYGVTENGTTKESVERLFTENSVWARSIFDLIPNKLANIAFRRLPSGEVAAADWFANMFLADSAEQAEMIYYRNLLNLELVSLGIKAGKGYKTDDSEDEIEGNDFYHALPRRMHQLVYRLINNDDGGMALQLFINKLESLPTTEAFISWVNETPMMHLDTEAPYVAWIDDVAEFNEERAGGGWGVQMPGAETREAITKARSRSDMLLGQLKEKRQGYQADLRTAPIIEQALADEAAGTLDDTSDGAQLLRGVRKIIRVAEMWQTAAGSRIGLDHLYSAIMGFYSNATDKGRAPTHTKPIGATEAVQDAFGFKTPYGRTKDSLTSFDLSDIEAQPSLTMKDAGRTMDDHGREVKWDKPTERDVLSWFTDPNLRDQAMARLFPTQWEADDNGAIHLEVLFGKSLTEAITGAHLKQYYPQDDQDKKSTSNTDIAADLTWFSMANGLARIEGGNQTFIEKALEIALVRKTGFDHAIDSGEAQSLAIDSQLDTVTLAKSVASFLSGGGTVDELEEIKQEILAEYSLKRGQVALGLDASLSQELIDAELNAWMQQKVAEHQRQVDMITDVYGDDTDLFQEYTAKADAEFEQFKERVELLRGDNNTHRIVQLYQVKGLPTLTQDRQYLLAQTVLDNPELFELAGELSPLVQKVHDHVHDSARNNFPDLSLAEWEDLSRLVIGVHLARAHDVIGAGITVQPWPKLEEYTKYMDHTFSYLLDEFFDANGALLKASRTAHEIAGLGKDYGVTRERLKKVALATVMNPDKLGDYTPETTATLIAERGRLSSSATEAGIQQPGVSPKQQHVFLGSTRRTYELPVDEQGNELLSHVKLTVAQLDAPLDTEVQVTMFGGATKPSPMYLMNNRFAKSVVLTWPGQTDPVDLITDVNVARPAYMDAKVIATPYREIHNDRILRAVQRIADEQGIDPSDITVDVEFFHPDSQPAGRDWFHNVFFEGTSFKLDADNEESLIATLWFANGSMNPAFQAAAMESQKTGLPAIAQANLVSALEREQMESTFDTDLAGVIRAKAIRLLKTSYGEVRLDPEFFNAVVKELKSQHFVVAVKDGSSITLNAEDVIAWQAANPGASITTAYDDARLWVPSDKILRAIHGETGPQTIDRVAPSADGIDPTSVPRFRGITDEMAQMFAPGLAGETLALEETVLAHRANDRDAKPWYGVSRKLRNQFDTQLKVWAEMERDGLADRASMSKENNQQFRKSRRKTNRKVIGDLDRNSSLRIGWFDLELPLESRDGRMSLLSMEVLKEIEQLQDTNGFRAAWRHRENGVEPPQQGVLTGHTVGKQRPGYSALPKDVVVVEIDSFNGDIKKMQKRLAYYASRGVYLVLVDETNADDSRDEMMRYALDSLQYERVAGAPHVLKPMALTLKSQNKKARTSTLTAMGPVSALNRMLVFLTNMLPLQENAAYVTDRTNRTQNIGIVNNVVFTGAAKNFNVPVNDLSNSSQVNRVRRTLRKLDTAEGRAHLADMTNSHIKDPAARATADTEFNAAFDRLIERLDKREGSVMLDIGDTWGRGDLMPLVGPGDQILLYRHGMKAPRPQARRVMMTDEVGGISGVAIYPSKIEENATVYRGTVTDVRPRRGHSFDIEMSVPFSEYGEKLVLQKNAIKYVTTPMRNRTDLQLPQGGFVTGGDISLIGSLDDTISKEGFEDTLNNHQTAFWLFGWDNLPYISRFLFGRDDAEAKGLTLDFLESLTRRNHNGLTREEAWQLQMSSKMTSSFTDLLVAAAGLTPGMDTDWLSKVNDQSAESEIALAALIYLATPGAQVSDIMRSGSVFNPAGEGSQKYARKMPRLFTARFDIAPVGSALRQEANRVFNARLAKSTGNGGWHLDESFKVTMFTHDGKAIEGMIQVPQVFSAGDDPVKNGQSFEESGTESYSEHSASIAAGAIGASYALTRDLSQLRSWAEDGNQEWLDQPDARDGGYWDVLFNMRDTKTRDPLWKAQTVGEVLRRKNARLEMVKYREPLNLKVDTPEHQQTTNQVNNVIDDVVGLLGLRPQQRVLMEYWIREWLGSPAGVDVNGEDNSYVSPDQALEAATAIRQNVANGHLPLDGGEVALMHVADLKTLFKAGRLALKTGYDKADTEMAESWSDWVKTAFGISVGSHRVFEPGYLLALDGFMHTYQNDLDYPLDLGISIDEGIKTGLLDPTVNNNLMKLASVDQPTARQLQEVRIFGTGDALLDELIGVGKPVADEWNGQAAAKSARAQKRKAWARLRKNNDVPAPIPASARNSLREGAKFIDNTTHTSSLIRMLMMLRIGTATLNPVLYVSMGPEMYLRHQLDRMANILTGQATTGMLAKAQARMTENANERFDAKQQAKIAELITQLDSAASDEERAAIVASIDQVSAGTSVRELLGLQSRFTPEQIRKLNTLYEVAGKRSSFKQMINQEFWHTQPELDSLGTPEKLLQKYAAMGLRMQDSTRGMRESTAARRYMEAALQSIMASPLQDIVDIDNLIRDMTTDPTYIKQHYPEVHRYAANAVAQIRSMKQTVLSATMKGVYEPFSESSRRGVNFMGNVFLKLPLIFSNYAFNVMTTITGLQGLNDMTAVWLDARKKGPGSIIGRAQKAIRGDADLAKGDEFFDMSEVLEGIDLGRSYLRGALTQTGLFTLGLMSQGLGLSGEDDEMKKRRLLAQHQGLGMLYDPRRLEQDFRNADAIFLDNVPGLNHFFGAGPDGRHMVQLHWMLKQFISPLVGMERFFNTGDVRQITWGFEDAFGAFPLINSMMFHDAVNTFHTLWGKGENELSQNDSEGLVSGPGFLINAVGTYERMLFENSFANQIYMGIDDYDRDPYVLPLRDSDGQIQRDIEGNPREQNIALQQFIDPETGKLKQGYLGRSDDSDYWHYYAETHASFGLVASLFHGGPGQSDYWRYNMPIKTRSLPLEPLDRKTAEAAMLQLIEQAGPQARLTRDEIAKTIKTNAAAKKDWDTYNNADKIAAKLAQQEGAEPLSVLDKDGREIITQAGAEGVFRGLAKGTVQLNSEALQGLYVPFEMRQAIAEKWAKEITQEGIDLGMDRTEALKRTQRIMDGPYDQPEIKGMKDILFAKPEDGGISYEPKAQYLQLNTTYVMGPDGRPWATGFKRASLLGALGLKPLSGQIQPQGDATTVDGRMNTVDLVNGFNTGLRALEPYDKSRNVPTDVEIGKSIEDAIKKAAQSDYTPFKPFNNSSSGGFNPYRRYSGGGGGGSYTPQMRPLPYNVAPYGNSTPFINTSNPIIRRASLSRQRIESDRGRLFQWQ